MTRETISCFSISVKAGQHTQSTDSDSKKLGKKFLGDNLFYYSQSQSY
jgi:hypothetical protein